MTTFASFTGMGFSVASLNMQVIRDAAMDHRWGGLQLMPSALRIIREYCGTVRRHVSVMVHPVLLCQAREALVCLPLVEYFS